MNVIHSTNDQKTTLCGKKYKHGMVTGNANQVTCPKCKEFLKDGNEK